MDREVPRRSEMTRLWKAKMPEKCGQMRARSPADHTTDPLAIPNVIN
jgi:hypothetical protein